jgi:hypothetical protein
MYLRTKCLWEMDKLYMLNSKLIRVMWVQEFTDTAEKIYCDIITLKSFLPLMSTTFFHPWSHIPGSLL